MDERTIAAGDAARALGISVDTLRRWDRQGRIRTERDGANRRRVPVSEVERLTGRRSPPAGPPTALSARNQFPGVVRDVRVDGVAAQVEIEAGPHRVVALITREAVEELGLRPGVKAVARVKATSVMIDRQAGPLGEPGG